jgi:putative transposase
VFELIQAEKASFPVRMMCEMLEVSHSGYYAWLRRTPSKRSGEETRLKVSIQEAHQRGRGTYGSPRVTQELKSQGLRAGRHRVARLMREQGLRGLPRRRAFRVTTTRTDPSLAVAPNTLDRGFSTTHLDQVWVSDLTYLDTQEGWLYLAAILDLGSRRIVGWSLEDNLGTQLPLRALRMALGHREAAKLHHSDRGCQYASIAYRSELARHGIECSMSRRGNCWDNAPMESFFSTLKRELAHRSAWQTRAQARQDVFDYIEVFYNRQRRHSALNYQTPSGFEEQLRAA